MFSVTHPVRWCFPDDPGPHGLVARHSYWDETPYVEQDERRTGVYVEHHRTLGDQVRALRAAGFAARGPRRARVADRRTADLGRLVTLAGRVIPGTAIFVCRLA